MDSLWIDLHIHKGLLESYFVRLVFSLQSRRQSFRLPDGFCHIVTVNTVVCLSQMCRAVKHRVWNFSFPTLTRSEAFHSFSVYFIT